MEVLTSTKSQYLLEAGLEVLHSQSNEWLSEIAFWRDEAAFFYTLLAKKTLKYVPVNAKNSIDKIEKELVSITGGELDELQKDVERHEVFLGSLLEGKRLNEDTYREKHEQLTFRILEFERRFKSLKKQIFTLVEQIDKNK
jgi:hypothetical protein